MNKTFYELHAARLDTRQDILKKVTALRCARRPRKLRG